MANEHPDDLLLQYLVVRKFSDQRRPPFSGPGLEYYKELCGMPPEEIKKLLKDERAQEAKEKRRVAERDDLYLCFSKPEADANFASWGRMDYWEPDEAAALLFGKDPNVVSWESISYLLKQSPFVQEYNKLRVLAERALTSKSLEPNITPPRWLAWAEEKEITYPTELKEQVEIFHGPKEDWKAQHDLVNAALANKDEEILRITAENDDLRKKMSKSEIARIEKILKSLRKVTIAMASGKFQYKPESMRNTATADIVKILEGLEIPLDDATVRERLRESAEEVDWFALHSDE